MTTFFTSDTHINHAKVLKYCNRPFRGVQEMDASIFASWAKTVGPGDTVYHLGDVALGRGRESVAFAVDVLKTLPGK